MQVVNTPAHSLRVSALLSSLAALALYLSFQPAGLWFLTFVWPALLYAAAREAPSKRSCALLVVVTHLPVFLAFEWWLRDVTALGYPALALYQSAWWAMLALLIRWLDRPILMRRGIAFTALPIALLAIEFLRGDLVCGGYPWFFAGHPLVASSMLSQCADVFGAATLTALVGACAGAGLDAFVAYRARDKGRGFGSILIICLLLTGALTSGQQKLRHRFPLEEPPSQRSAHILVVQPSVSTSNKIAWTPKAQVEDTQRGITLTLDGLKSARAANIVPALTVWPETMLPGLGLEPETLDVLERGGYWPGTRFSSAIEDLVKATSVPLLIGSTAVEGLRVEPTDPTDASSALRFAWDHQFNSVYLVQGSAPYERYDKVFLTPFGETMPVISSWSWLESQLLAFGAAGMTFDLDAGSEFHRFALATKSAGDLRIATPICFEDSMGWVCRRMVFESDGWFPFSAKRAADVLIAPSNDGWFGTSTSGRAHHFDFARLRAIELRTPVIRCVNTGYSTWIDAAGRVRGVIGDGSRGEINLEGTLLANIAPSTYVPLSARTADLLSWIAVLLCAVKLTWIFRKHRSA